MQLEKIPEMPKNIASRQKRTDLENGLQRVSVQIAAVKG